jgi:uncharacterized glyoxalase superfamily protein PhnB
VGTVDERVVAYLAMRGPYIDRMYVDPREWRKGWGTRFIDFAKSLCPDGLELHTHQENHAARRLYEKHGFKAVRFGTSPPPECAHDVEYHWRPDDTAMNPTPMRLPHEHPAGLTNRSMPPSVIIPVLAYPDVREAVDWLCRSFGFIERLRIGNHRAQLSFGEGSVIVTAQRVDASASSPQTADSRGAPAGGSSHSVMVRVVDADIHYEHARQSGARIVSPPTDYPYGERQYTAEDLGGHRWTFSQTIADVDPVAWGGILVE